MAQLGMAAAFGVVAAVLLYLRPTKEPAHLAGFSDTCLEAGIHFKMAFLPDEQGEKFKVNLYDHGCGVLVADYNADGLDDIFLLNQLGANGIFRNLGDGRFFNAIQENPALALEDRICVGGTFADFDNDGDQDLYITSTRGGNVLYENVAGHFDNITARAGVDCVAHSQTAAFFDCDNDGDLDLFVTNTAKWTSDEFDELSKYYIGPTILWEHVDRPEDLEPNRLFRNDGDRTFTDITGEAGLTGKGWSGDIAVFDFDEDGDLDLFVTNMFGLSQLYANQGDGHFEDVTKAALQRTSYGAIGCKAFDYNNDGRLDLLVADMHSDMWIDFDEGALVEPSKKYKYLLGRQPELDRRRLAAEKKWIERLGIDYRVLLFGNTLFRNEGQGRFTEVSDAAGIETFWPWGVAVGDFNNDGYEDAYLPSGMGYPFFYHPSYLMMNCGDGTFINAAEKEGLEPPPGGRYLPEEMAGKKAARSSRCAAAADFDGDGRLDLVVNNFNDRPYLYHNRFTPRNFIQFRLVGTKSNRDAIGAVMKIHCGEHVMVRQVQSSGGYLSQSSKTLHFGLGDFDHIDRAEIRWPSGVRQTLESPKVNTLSEIREPQ